MGLWGSKLATDNNRLRFLLAIVVGVAAIILVMSWHSELILVLDDAASSSVNTSSGLIRPRQSSQVRQQVNEVQGQLSNTHQY